MHENETKDAILQTLMSIPKGRVCTYGTVAKLAGVPGQARYVGYILRSLPISTSIPWHRVINSKGKSSFPPGGKKYSCQIERLQQEGIITSDDVIKLKTYHWLGE